MSLYATLTKERDDLDREVDLLRSYLKYDEATHRQTCKERDDSMEDAYATRMKLDMADDRIGELLREVEGLRGYAAELECEYSDLLTSFKASEETIAELKADLAVVEEDANKAEERVFDLEGDLNGDTEVRIGDVWELLGEPTYTLTVLSAHSNGHVTVMDPWRSIIDTDSKYLLNGYALREKGVPMRTEYFTPWSKPEGVIIDAPDKYDHHEGETFGGVFGRLTAERDKAVKEVDHLKVQLDVTQCHGEVNKGYEYRDNEPEPYGPFGW